MRTHPSKLTARSLRRGLRLAIPSAVALFSVSILAFGKLPRTPPDPDESGMPAPVMELQRTQQGGRVALQKPTAPTQRTGTQNESLRTQSSHRASAEIRPLPVSVRQVQLGRPNSSGGPMPMVRAEREFRFESTQPSSGRADDARLVQLGAPIATDTSAESKSLERTDADRMSTAHEVTRKERTNSESSRRLLLHSLATLMPPKQIANRDTEQSPSALPPRSDVSTRSKQFGADHQLDPLVRLGRPSPTAAHLSSASSAQLADITSTETMSPGQLTPGILGVRPIFLAPAAPPSPPSLQQTTESITGIWRPRNPVSPFDRSIATQSDVTSGITGTQANVIDRADAPQEEWPSDATSAPRTTRPVEAPTPIASLISLSPSANHSFQDAANAMSSEEIGVGTQVIEERSVAQETENQGSDSVLPLEQVAQMIGRERVLPDRVPVTLSLQEIIAHALSHSKNIQVLRLRPAEVLQDVRREYGQFDWRGFVDSRFAQESQPVGNIFQTNQPIDQFRNDDINVDFGLRKTTVFGGEIELRESLGTRDSNSGILVPEDQGNARMSVTFSQEFLRDGGRDIVLSRALIASLTADQSHADSFAQVNNVLRDVLVQYWDLYQRRADFFVQRSLTVWAKQTLDMLESRARIDAEENSIEQARALWLEAQADLENARASVLIAQDTLFRTVNSPALDSSHFEILTAAPPQATDRNLNLSEEFPIALANRSEISRKLSEIHAAAVEHHVSLNQLLPKLSLSLESSLNALDERRDFWGAKANLTDVDPSYQANLNLEFYIGNRTARARNKAAQIALQRLQLEYEDQIEQVRLDVSSAMRTINSANLILDQRYRTVMARQQEIDYLRLRRDVIPQQNVSTMLTLEQLFQAVSRWVRSQQAYFAAIGDQQRALAGLLQAKGLLLSPLEIPGDVDVAVPRPVSAGHAQWQNKAAIRDDARTRVIAPDSIWPSGRF